MSEPNGVAVVAKDKFQAETALRESEQRLTQAVNLARLGIFEHDHVTGVYQCSQLFRTIFGFGEENITSDAILERIFPEDRRAAASTIYQSHNPLDASHSRLEHRILRPDGIRWVLVRAETFFEGEGDARHPLRTVGATVDITEQKRAELELFESRRQLRTAVDAAKLGVWRTDLETEIITGDELARSIFGWAGDETVTLGMLLNRIVEEDRERFKERQDALIHGLAETDRGLEYRIQLPGGSIRWVSVFGTLARNSSGQPAHLTGVAQDITERKQSEIELRSSQQTLCLALDAARLGVWSRDLRTGAITGDSTTRRIFGWSEDQAITLETLLNCIVPEDREQFREQRPNGVSGWGECDIGIEYRIQSPDGDIRWVSSRGSMVRDSSGEPALLAGVVQDITSLKQAEAEKQGLELQFLHAQKLEAVGRLAGGIAHDFNNLLMVIRSYTEMTQDSLPANDRLRKNTQAVMKAADRAASLTGQMLAFSRKQVLSPVVLNLNAAVADSAKMLQRLIGEDIDLQVIPAEAAWTVLADPDQIAQVLMNLSVNARDAMPEGGTLTIATRNLTTEEAFIAKYPYFLPGDYAVFSVADTGTGISKEVIERMFEPFFTTKTVGKGTGLGLSTVYGIVKQSGGYLLVDSELGQGACFTIYLPRVKDSIPDAEFLGHERMQFGTETLLVVEDEDGLRESIAEFLVALGYKILSAESGHKALAIAAQFEQPIDLMITDVVMPKMSGRELSQMLGSLRPEMKTIFMSGYTDDAIVRHGVQDDGIAFLQKPFSLATLSRKVRDVLGKDPKQV